MRKILVLGVLVLASTAFGADKMDPATLSVTGTATVSAVPDLIDIQLGVRTEAESAREALGANSKAMQRVYNAIQEQAIPAKDIQTSQFQIRPTYEDTKNRAPRLTGYAVSNMVNVTLRDPNNVALALDAAIKAGANQVHGIAFRVENPDKLLDDVRVRAVADAKRKAEMIAKQAGVKLGVPLRIEVQEAHRGETYTSMRLMSDVGGAPPIAAGEKQLSAAVSVVYEIRADESQHQSAR